jgi:hypothetical protein
MSLHFVKAPRRRWTKMLSKILLLLCWWKHQFRCGIAVYFQEFFLTWVLSAEWPGRSGIPFWSSLHILSWNSRLLKTCVREIEGQFYELWVSQSSILLLNAYFFQKCLSWVPPLQVFSSSWSLILSSFSSEKARTGKLSSSCASSSSCYWYTFAYRHIVVS